MALRYRVKTQLVRDLIREAKKQPEKMELKKVLAEERQEIDNAIRYEVEAIVSGGGSIVNAETICKAV